ncbi:hypothetical protein [Nonomuraea sp. CA-141351]
MPSVAFFWMPLLPTALAFAEGDIDSAGACATVALAVLITWLPRRRRSR